MVSFKVFEDKSIVQTTVIANLTKDAPWIV